MLPSTPCMGRRRWAEIMTQAVWVPPRSVVLVVDHDPAVRNSLKFALEIEGFSVKVYATATALLAEPDMPQRGCVVLDYNLPGMNGLDLLQSLREHHVKLPAILVTSHPTPTVRHRALSAGVHVIEKPLLNDTLLRCIRAALGDDDDPPRP